MKTKTTNVYDRELSGNLSENLSGKTLIDIIGGLKSNTAAWAKIWVMSNIPEIDIREHHIISLALVGFRARYNSATEAERDQLKKEISESISKGFDEKTTV